MGEKGGIHSQCESGVNDMGKFVQDFYDNKVDANAKQKGFLGYFYYKLIKFEKHRYEVVEELFSKNKIRKEFVSFLDIGCNGGGFLAKITKKIQCKEFFGIDVSENALQQCRSRFPEFLENFFLENIDSGLHFENEKFDLVTMIAVLEHTFDPLFVASEISRILKKDGIFIVEVPNIAFIMHRVNLFFGKRPRTSWDYGWDGGHLQLFDIKSLRELLKKNGFEILEVTGSGIFQKMRKYYGSLLLSDIMIVAKKL